MYTEQQDGFIALKKTLRKRRNVVEVTLRDSCSSENCTLALFGFSHALAVFLTLLLGYDRGYDACSLRQSICNLTILCCMVQKLEQ